jgi:hypothetical protein
MLNLDGDLQRYRICSRYFVFPYLAGSLAGIGLAALLGTSIAIKLLYFRDE